jgi:hypothetical protein
MLKKNRSHHGACFLRGVFINHAFVGAGSQAGCGAAIVWKEAALINCLRDNY